MVERLAGQLHMARSTVSEYRKIANNLGKAGLEAMERGRLDKSAALELASLPEGEQEQLIQEGVLTYTEIREYRKKKPKGTGAAGIEADKPAVEEAGRKKCIVGKSKSGFCGAAAYCGEPVNCCAACKNDCNGRCGWLDEPVSPSGAVEDVQPKKPEVSIDELDFSIKTYNILKSSGIDTLEQLMELSQQDLMKLRGMGKRSLQEIEDALEGYPGPAGGSGKGTAKNPGDQKEKSHEQTSSSGTARPELQEDENKAETGPAGTDGSTDLMPAPVKDSSWFVKEYFAGDGREFLPQIMRLFREEKTLDGKTKAVKELISPEGGYGGGNHAFWYDFGSYSRGVRFKADGRAAKTNMTYKELTLKLLELYDPWALEWLAGETKGPSRGMVQDRYAELLGLLEDMPRFQIKDIEEYSQKLERELREYQEMEAASGKPMPEKPMVRHRMRVAGLRLLLKLETDRTD